MFWKVDDENIVIELFPNINILDKEVFMTETVKVMVRCRPMNQKERDRGCKSVVDVDGKNNQINLLKPDSNEIPKSFSYDFVFATDSLQSLIYEQSAFSLVDSVLDGYNGTIFAYGQTGCGKTHTMMGTTTQQGRGIIPRTFSQIMTITQSDSSKTHLIRCSFIQIYNEQIHDLLGKDIKAKMDLKQSPDSGVYVKGLTEITVDNIDTMQKYMQLGFNNRSVRATNMNNQSSRSHSIFTIKIQSKEELAVGEDKQEKFKVSKLNLVDLAGSQRASKTGVSGEGMKQATKINLSLSALGNVISALVDGKTHHIPYRDSKLTRLLEDSLGGNTKTIMIAAVSPADYNYDETLSTLRYASRAKFIKNKPKINEDPKDAMLREMTEEIKKLKAMLEGKMPIQPSIVHEAMNGEVTQRIVYRDRQGNIENKENSQLEEALRSKQQMLRMEQEQKRLMQQKLLQLENMFTRKQPADSHQNEVEMQKIKKLKQKLKIQKKKQEQYMKQKAKREEQILNIEKNYKSLNEEVDEMRERFDEVKKKYIGNLAELRDIQDEHEDEKEELLDTIRYQEKEVKKFQAILSILMSSEQLDVIINNSDWNEEKRQWTIPNFVYKEKMIALPKLQHGSRDLDSEKEKKEVIFRNSQRNIERKEEKQKDSFRVNHIVKGARQNTNESLSSTMAARSSNNIVNRAQLTPLKNDSHQRVVKQKNSLVQQKRRKIDKLDPIQFVDSTKKL